jgi:predicted RNA-binding Zn ribbon-like protein
LDLSRGKTRRWCSMDDCGNRAKARRHYARGKVAARVRKK